MINKIYLYSFLCFLFCSCERKNSIIDLFKKQVTVEHQIIDIKDDSFFSKTSNILKDKNFLVLQDETHNTFFSIFDLEKQSIISKCLEKGQGPNELIGSPFSTAIIPDSNLLIYDVNTNKLLNFNYLIEKNIELNAVISFPNDIRPLRIIPVTRDYYVAIGFFEQGKYLLLDKSGEVISYAYDYPNISNQSLTSFEKVMALQGNIVPHPIEKKFFYYDSTTDTFEIVEILSDESLNRIAYYFNKHGIYIPDGDGRNIATSKNSEVMFLSAAASEKYIYLLYSGRIIKENIYKAFKGNTVFVFDWAGNPIKRYNLDVDINYLTVNENDNTLYAIADLKEDTYLIKFDLK